MSVTSAALNASMLPADMPVQLVDHEGSVTDSAHHDRYDMPSTSVLLKAYEQLVIGRRVNDQAGALVRQGKMAVYPSSHGQEACQVGAALCLETRDWLFPTYRDTVAVMARGIDPVDVFVGLRGGWHSGFDPLRYHVSTQTTPLSTQLLHAVGVAHAAKLKGEDTVVLAMCGDGATSEGDFHEALNFAAVFRVPVVFLVQNNEFAISVPLERQSAAPSLAHKAIGYGMPGQRVDGNDMAGILAVLADGVEHARQGDGPSLVEAHTYRMQAHTNADDDTRYRSKQDVARWSERDPLIRMRRYLRDQDVLAADVEDSIFEAAESVATALRDALSGEVETDPDDLFKYVYSEPTPQLREQSEMLREELSREGA